MLEALDRSLIDCVANTTKGFNPGDKLLWELFISKHHPGLINDNGATRTIHNALIDEFKNALQRWV